MKNRYFLMRHGQSEANRQDMIVSDPDIGCTSYGLTELGRRQARESALHSGLNSQTRIVSSDFLRARETAQIARDVLGCPEMELCQGLRERFFGQFEGASGARYQEVWARDDQDPDNVDGGVESPRRLATRLGQTLEELERRHKGQTILLVSHGDTLRFLQLLAAERPLTEHMMLRHFAPAEIRALEELLYSASGS